MIFQVFNSDGNCVMVTEDESCIPYTDIESMSKAGYRFKIDGKVVSKNTVISAVKCSNSNVTSTSKTPPTRSKQVRCVDTGKIYKNQAEAAKDLNIDPAQVSDSIKTGRPRSGHLFERVV